MNIKSVPIDYEEYKEIVSNLSDLKVKKNFFLPEKEGILDLFMIIDKKSKNIVGFWSSFEYTKWEDNNRAYSSIYILPQYRGKGLTKVIYDDCFSKIEDSWIYARVHKENKKSIFAHNKFCTFLYSYNRKRLYLYEGEMK